MTRETINTIADKDKRIAELEKALRLALMTLETANGYQVTDCPEFSRKKGGITLYAGAKKHWRQDFSAAIAKVTEALGE